MDCKSQLITNILVEMETSLNSVQMQILKHSLITKLNDYELIQSEKSKYALMTIDNFNDFVLNHYRAIKKAEGLSERTVNQYYYHARKFLVRMNKKAIDITAKEIELFLIEYKHLNEVSNTTLLNFKTYINNFYNFLVKEEYLTQNPCDKVIKIKTDTIRDLPFTKVEEEKLYQNCDNPRDKALMELLFATGCRAGEIVTANINQLDFSTKQLTVIGKGNKKRTVCVSDKALYYLDRYLKTRTDNNSALFVDKRRIAKRLTVSGVENILKKIAKTANVENCYPHRVRATFATRLIDSGLDIHKVSKLMGHTDISTTMIYYRGNYDISNDYNKLANSL